MSGIPVANFQVCAFEREVHVGRRTISVPKIQTPVLLILLCCIGCAHPLGNEQVGAKASQQVPFRDTADAPGAPVSDSSLAVPTEGGLPPRDVPFHPQNLPQGTLINVRLNRGISTTTPGTTTNFTATLDEPVIVDGRTVLPRGVTVSGQVASSPPHSSPSERGGYLRLTLTSIEAGGHDLSVSTSTLFARGTIGPSPDGNRVSTVQLEEGRRLTFRLSEPLVISGQVAMSRR